MLRPRMQYGRTNRAPEDEYHTFFEEDNIWRRHWPFVAATIMGVFLLIFGLAVAALEAAGLEKGSSIDTSSVKVGSTRGGCGGPYRIGVGIWSGAIVAVAGIFIFIINCGTSVKHWAKASLAAVGSSVVFCVINLSINAKIVRTGVTSGAFKSNSSDEYIEYRLAASQVAAASLSFLVCLAFLIMYGIVFCFRIRPAVPKRRKGGFLQ